MLDTLKSYFYLARAGLKIRNIEKEIEQISTELAGEPFKHETTLIKIALIAPAALYYSLPKKERNEKKFNEYLRMMSFGLYSGDLEDAVNDGILSGDKVKEIQKHFIDKSHGLAKDNGLYEAFIGAETQSRDYQDYEASLTEYLNEKDTDFIELLFKENSTLENLTYDRIAVLYTFGVKAAFNMFLRNTSASKYEKNIDTWSKYLPIALQEGYDDIDDLEEDTRDNRPTPLILRGIRAKLRRNEDIIWLPKLNESGNVIWSISSDKKLAEYGIAETKSQVQTYFREIESLDLPPVLHLITQKVKDKITIL